MASKIHLMKFLQEVRGYDLVTRRAPLPRLEEAWPGLWDAQLAAAEAPPCRRLQVTVSATDNPDRPHPVQIRRAADSCATS